MTTRFIKFAKRCLIVMACATVLLIAVIAMNWDEIRDWAANLSVPPTSWED